MGLVCCFQVEWPVTEEGYWHAWGEVNDLKNKHSVALHVSAVVGEGSSRFVYLVHIPHINPEVSSCWLFSFPKFCIWTLWCRLHYRRDIQETAKITMNVSGMRPSEWRSVTWWKESVPALSPYGMCAPRAPTWHLLLLLQTWLVHTFKNLWGGIHCWAPGEIQKNESYGSCFQRVVGGGHSGGSWESCCALGECQAWWER